MPSELSRQDEARALLKQLNWSQEKAAEYLDISVRAFQQYLAPDGSQNSRKMPGWVLSRLEEAAMEKS